MASEGPQEFHGRESRKTALTTLSANAGTTSENLMEILA